MRQNTTSNYQYPMRMTEPGLKHIKTQNHDQTKPIGLKNSGNTCFLNAIIQFLFSIDIIKNKLFNYSKLNNFQFSENDFCMLLGNIFRNLQEKKYSFENSKNLYYITEYLYQQGMRFHRYSQEDARDIFLQIIFLIEQRYQKIKQKTDIDHEIQCKCGKFPMNQKTLAYSKMRCMRCHQNIKRILKKSPRYIIYFNSAKEPIVQFKKEQNQSHILNYKYKAQIIYHGTGLIGHYIAKRMENGHQYQLNDIRVNICHRKSFQALQYKIPHYYYLKTSNVLQCSQQKNKYFQPGGLILLYQLCQSQEIKQKGDKLRSQSFLVNYHNSQKEWQRKRS